MKPRLVVPLVALCAAIAVAGCGSSKKSNSTGAANTAPSTGAQASTSTTTTPSGGASAGGASTLKLAADPGGALKFDKTSLTAKAGKVTLDMSNPSPTQHAIGVKGSGVQKTGTAVGQGANSTVTVTLKPGSYEFYCPVDGHEAGGMKGTLTVK